MLHFQCQTFAIFLNASVRIDKAVHFGLCTKLLSKLRKENTARH